MPSEDSDVPNSESQRFSSDDFRLRLDSPMSQRGSEPSESVRRELPWERTADARSHTVPLVATMPRLPTFAELIREPVTSEPTPQSEPIHPSEPSPLSETNPSAELTSAAEPTTSDLAPAMGETHTPAPYTADEVLAELAIRVSTTPPRGISPVLPSGPAPIAPVSSSGALPDLTPLSDLTPYADILQAAQRSTPAPVAPAPAPQPSVSAVQAELDRLAFVPDRDEPVAPVSVPEIVVAEAAPAMPPMVSTPAMPVASAPAAMASGQAAAMPTLSDHEMYQPRAITHTTVRRDYSEFMSALHTPRRRKRHPVRRMFATIVMLAMLGGGLFAAKYYYFDQRWDADVKPLAADVEKARGLEFDHAVEVSSLPASEYAARLVKSTVGVTDDDLPTVAGGWRALGLLSGDLDPAAVGLAALGDAPAFYDPGSETIYVLEDLPTELRAFALHRALTLALLDQHYGWWGTAHHASPAVARGMRALYDGDALSIATGLLDDQQRAAVLSQQAGLRTAYPAPAVSAQYAVAVASRLGVALRPYFDATPPESRVRVENGSAVTDAAALDLRRLLNGTATAGSADSQGMLFWYHVLAARVDDNQAWHAALLWRDDAVSFIGGERSCVSAVLTVDPAGYESVLRAFNAWAAAAPGEAETAVTATSPANGQLSVSACDPGASIATNSGLAHLSLGGAPLDSEQYRSLATAFSNLAADQLACAAYGDDTVSPADERGVVDPVGGWAVPGNHPAPDPNEAGCVPSV